MPRKKPAWPKGIRPLDHIKKGSEPEQPVVEGVTVVQNAGARKLVTIGPDHPWWSGDGIKGTFDFRDLELGSLVRVLPPADAPQQLVDELVAVVTRYAAAVKVQGRAASPKVPVSTERSPEEHVRRGPREVVIELANEVLTVDRKALLELVERTLAEVGL